MHTHAKNGVGVSVINGTTNCTALGVELNNGLMLARVPHGPVKVRISAQHDVEVQLYFEDQNRLTTTLPAGVHTIERDNSGQALLFTAPSEIECESTDEAHDDDIRDLRESTELPDYVQLAMEVIKAGNNSQVKSIHGDGTLNAIAAAPAAPVEDELSFSAVTKSMDTSATPVASQDPAVTATTPVTAAEKRAAKRQLSRGFLAVVVKHVEKPNAPGTVPPSYDEAIVTFQLNAPEKHNLAVGANFHRIVPPEPTTKKWCSCCNH